MVVVISRFGDELVNRKEKPENGKGCRITKKKLYNLKNKKVG